MQIILIPLIAFARKIARLLGITTAYLRTKIVIQTFIIIFRQLSTPITNIKIPVTLIHKNIYILMIEIPSDIVIIIPVLRRIKRQRKIPAAKPRTLLTQNLLITLRLTLFTHVDRFLSHTNLKYHQTANNL